MNDQFADDKSVMRWALELAARGVGYVEPNPPVGAVIADRHLTLLGEGFHERFGGPHAEINALAQAGDRASGATLFVTLEPCCHHGKTPPCTRAVIEAGIGKVVVGIPDPSPHAAGRGLSELQQAGIATEIGLLEPEIRQLTAPFLKRVETGLPYVHAKWAMTLDGKIASRTGSSQWISGPASRDIVQQLRGRMDAIVVGARTTEVDNPLLLARPPGPRTAVRVVVDSALQLPLDTQLVQTVDQAPLLIATAESVADERVQRLQQAGAEVLKLPPADSSATTTTDHSHLDLHSLLRELARRDMTNILVEGGGGLLGSFFDGRHIDECHVFLASKLLGGAQSVTPIAGLGLAEISRSPSLDNPEIKIVAGDVYIHGRVRWP